MTAHATCQADTLDTNAGQRDHSARAAARTAVVSPTASAVNPTRSGPARASKWRNQARTVAAGRLSNRAMRRCPHPAPATTSATPITPTASARRKRQLTGSNTCVL